eukprot:7353532-Prymnesium_polylepis.2
MPRDARTARVFGPRRLVISVLALERALAALQSMKQVQRQLASSPADRLSPAPATTSPGATILMTEPMPSTRGACDRYCVAATLRRGESVPS